MQISSFFLNEVVNQVILYGVAQVKYKKIESGTWVTMVTKLFALNYYD